MAPRIAKALDVFRSQINAIYPNRSKVSDGWIGDPAHAARESDHNPTSAGVVTALDITHDPGKGPDTWRLAEILRQNRDPRIKYVISNGRIFSSVTNPWTWRPYTGANKHAQHIHISVLGDSRAFDDTRPWKLDLVGAVPLPPEPPKPKGVTADMRRRMVEAIMAYEGHPTEPKVFIAPDGRPEISGITQKDHPAKYAELKELLDLGLTNKLRETVLAYYDQYTAPAKNWTDQAGPMFFLSDCILNRGPTGAAEILQMAVGVPIDHQVGPTTRGALAALAPDVAIDRLRAARELYEDKKYPQRRTSGQWQGMLNRWNKAQAQAKAFQKEQGYSPVRSPEGAAGTAVIVVGTGAAVAVKQDPWTGVEAAMAVFSIAVVAVVIFMLVRKARRQS